MREELPIESLAVSTMTDVQLSTTVLMFFFFEGKGSFRFIVQ